MTRVWSNLQLLRGWAAYAALPASALVTAPLLANVLGPVGRGELAGLLQPLTLAGAVAALGAPSAATYFTARGASIFQVRTQAWRICLVATAVVGLALLQYSSIVEKSLGVERILILTVWALFLPSSFISVQRGIVQGMRGYLALDIERLTIAISRVFIITLLWLCGIKSVFVYAISYLVPGLVSSLVLFSRKYHNRGDQRLSPSSFNRYSMTASFGTISVALSARLDQAIMPIVVGPAQLGLYSVAIAVADISSIITMVVSRNVLAESSGGADKKSVSRTIIVGAVAQLILVASLFIFLPFVLPIVFGISFSHAIPIVHVLLISSFLGYGVNVVSALLSGQGRPGLGSWIQGAAAASTIVLFVAFWGKLDVIDIAWISVVSQLFALVLAVAFLILSARNKAAHDA